ncbi:hypothetical protein PMAN_a2647 [Pseudoalteromonas marina]|nr:hypothetical protein PMAN_a2647 [Pseudoalteromonas marina]
MYSKFDTAIAISKPLTNMARRSLTNKYFSFFKVSHFLKNN